MSPCPRSPPASSLPPCSRSPYPSTITSSPAWWPASIPKLSPWSSTPVNPTCASDLPAPLRHEWLPARTLLAARFKAPAWDSALQWGVPYMWNGTGTAYTRSLQPPPARWADLWSPRLKGRLTMLDDPEDMLGACLKKLGLPFSATAPAQLARA